MGESPAGYYTSQTLLDIVVLHTGYYFTLRSGRQNQQLRGCKIEKNGERLVDCVHVHTVVLAIAQYVSMCAHY